MGRMIFALLIALGITSAACLLSHFELQASAGQALHEVQSARESGDVQTALIHIREATVLWRRHIPKLKILIPHEDIEKADEDLIRCEYALLYNDVEEFQITSENLIQHFSSMLSEEQLTWDNLM